ncbi:hypothetical protein CEXT_27091 [Caerostris extrusa]|uniref:Uncharacterized protein n=1 Tax=Caerostris extrusa TaxID=172846 RepID=A0AAV4N098_CAEEX|nr:hypothetical protein CEXT_27091 [Caerostris extrusa]
MSASNDFTCSRTEDNKAASDHHHRQAARNFEERVQQQPQTGQAREGAVEPGHRLGHASGPGVVPEQARQGEEAQERRRKEQMGEYFRNGHLKQAVGSGGPPTSPDSSIERGRRRLARD